MSLSQIETEPGGLDPTAVPVAPGPAMVGRSPGRLAWERLRKNRTAVVSGWVMLFFVLLGVAAPLVELLYGIGPYEQFQDKIANNSLPLGYLGGVSGEHWFGLEPRLGRDVFIRLVYGLRTSLLIATSAALLTTAMGIVLGIVAGYLGGWIDAVISWVIDFALALPFLIFALAVMPTVTARFYGPRDDIDVPFRIAVMILLFAMFGWTGTARLVRGQVVSLREREFVEAARASGAGLWHILFRQLLPNLWAPILITFSLAVPGYITGEAALSFLGIGIVDPTPDFGVMISKSLEFIDGDPMYLIFSGTVIFLLVLAFNLFGDGLRDALDPKSSR
ncbi:ABC transporter permease [Catellatospora sp. NPDC049609]|uniref:ABC transporter permease n=1 Tax=Catellatospora sp. NPDC049609 TaxID=3155505 RepID=UPI00343DAF2E